MNQFGSQNRNITQIKTQFERGFHQVDYEEEVESTTFIEQLDLGEYVD